MVVLCQVTRIKKKLFLWRHHDVTNPLMTLTTGWHLIVPSLMLVPVAVSEELKQTDRLDRQTRHTDKHTDGPNCALYIRCLNS